MYYMVFGDHAQNPQKHVVKPLMIHVTVTDAALKSYSAEEVLHNIKRDMAAQLYKFLIEDAAEALDIEREYDMASGNHVFAARLNILVREGKQDAKD